MRPDVAELQRYVQNGDEDAFGRLVSRYIGLVHATACRRLGGDVAAAKDVTQIVFTDLAKNAQKLAGDIMLGGWLHRHTNFVASKFRRAETRRNLREAAASEMTGRDCAQETAAPELLQLVDEAVDELPDLDRQVLVLRFFQGETVKSAGELLGISEDATQKRIQRGLEKLRSGLGRKGVVVSGAGLATVMAAAVPGVIPSLFCAEISTQALLNATAHGSPAAMAIKGLFTAHKAAVVVAGSAICVGIALLTQKQVLPPTPAPVNSAPASGISRPPASVGRTFPGPRLRVQTPVEAALSRFYARIDTGDEDAIVNAIYSLSTEFDLADEAQRTPFRTVIPRLVDLWAGGSERIRAALMLMLDRMRPPTPEMVDIYVECLGSTNRTAINAATSALTRSGPSAQRAVPALVEQINRLSQRLVGATNIWEMQTRDASQLIGESIDALGTVGPGAAEALPTINYFLQQTNNEWFHLGAAKAYWKITQDPGPVVPALTAALLKNDWSAADILKDMGKAATPALDALRAAYASGTPDAQMHAYKALLAIDPSNPPDIQPVRNLLNTENLIPRLDAAEAVWAYARDAQEVLPVITTILQKRSDFSPDVLRILSILNEMGPSAADALPAVKKVIETEGAYVDKYRATNTWAIIAPGTPIPAVRHPQPE